MSRIPQTAVLILFATLSGQGQQDKNNRGSDRFAATISELQGVCIVRDKEGARTRRLKLGDGLRADQQVQCEAKATLKIRFRSSGLEKQIKPGDPPWYDVPNVIASLPKEGGLNPPMGRRKGDELPVRADTASEPIASPQNMPALVPVRTLQNRGTAEPDVADLYWRKRQKYFLIVAAGKTAGIANDIAFTTVDAERVSTALTTAGYSRLDVLEDNQATRENFISALGKIRSKPKTAVVVIYYSGHASTDSQKTDLWLQLYGQRRFGPYHGLSLSDIVKAARDGGYAGDLSIILDSCYSGEGAETTELSLKEAKDTTILASSADYQPSYSMALPNGGEMSAFTYFMIEGLGPAWYEADGDHDGMMFYSELQAYIGTKLLEKVRDRGIPQIMEPQLFGQPSKSWLAYDPRHALNLNSQPRNQLRLRLSLEVQDPEATIKQLEQTIPANADAYTRALHAIKANRFEEAERLLETAETEDRVSDAVVFWARAICKERSDDSTGARVWYERALASSTQRNIDLMGAAALANVNVGNLIRGKDLLSGVLATPAEGGDSNETVLGSLLAMVIFDLLEGNQSQAELHLRRLQAVGPTVLAEMLGEDSDQIVNILSDIVANKRTSAKRRVEAWRQSLSTKESSQQGAFKKFDDIISVLLGPPEKNIAPATPPKDKLRDWSRHLSDHDPNSLVSLLQQLRTSAWESTEESEFLRSPEVTALLVQTVDFARRHKSVKQKITLRTAKGPVEVELPGSERESTLESSSLLQAAGDIYAERNDGPEAEKLYKQVISLADEEKLGPKVAFDALFRLASLYEEAGRFIDTETLYTERLAKPNESLGEQNLFTFGLYKLLGDLYANWNRPADAERSYRNLLRITQSQPLGMWDTLGRETLARFLVNHKRYEEAASLFEQVIARYEPRQKSAFWVVDSLGEDYFHLGRSYYELGRFDLAERNFRKAFAIHSSAEEPNLNWQSSTLVWQWFTADSLKKHEEAARFYRELIRLIQTELAQPEPDGFLGASLRELVASFRDAKEFSKADELLRLALAIQKKKYGDNSRETGRVWQSLGNLDMARGQYRNAIASFKISQTIYERLASPPLADLSFVSYRIGEAQYSQLEFEQARLELIRSTTLLDKHPEAGDPDNYSRHLLAIVERRLGNFDAAKKILQPFLDESQPANPSKVFFALLELTTIARSQGAFQEANQCWARAQTAAQKINPADLKEDSLFHYQKAMMAFVNGKGDAAQLMEAAIAKGENDTKTDQPLFLEYLDDYAVMLRKQGKANQAVLIEQRAKEIRDRIMREK